MNKQVVLFFRVRFFCIFLLQDLETNRPFSAPRAKPNHHRSRTRSAAVSLSAACLCVGGLEKEKQIFPSVFYLTEPFVAGYKKESPL